MGRNKLNMNIIARYINVNKQKIILAIICIIAIIVLIRMSNKHYKNETQEIYDKIQAAQNTNVNNEI